PARLEGVEVLLRRRLPARGEGQGQRQRQSKGLPLGSHASLSVLRVRRRAATGSRSHPAIDPATPEPGHRLRASRRGASLPAPPAHVTQRAKVMAHEGAAEPSRLRLGNIVYSNCFPVHARLLDRPRPDDPRLVEGIPSLLNGLLARGELDVSPSSSIEYARHAERYRILPDLVIGSRGAVRSILLLGDRPPEELGGRTVALPTASATSVVPLKILL